jgi:hypothetical protein
MNRPRRYQILPDQAACHQPGCAFHREGETAEFFGEQHAATTGHEVRVKTSAVVIFEAARSLERAS